MARQVRTARGEMVDFDAILIKQQIAQAPMNIEVARRKEFIDAKEGKSRAKEPVSQTHDMFVSNEPVRSTVEQAPIDFTPTQEQENFEIESPTTRVKKQKPIEEPVPILPDRAK